MGSIHQYPPLAWTALYLVIPHCEGCLPEEGFRSSSSLCVRLAAPDKDHWSIHADKKFTRIISQLVEECQQRLLEAKGKERAEVEGEEMEDQKGEEAAAAAATAVALPNSTTSAMETERVGEGPDSGAPPAHPVPVQRPLEHLMRDMGLEAKERDIIFPITPTGKPPPYDHELLAENRKRAEEAMKKIRSLHLQVIYNAGAVRQVDRILEELLMAQSKPDDGSGSEHQPPRVLLCHRNIWRYSPRGAENSSRAHGEQPGPLQSPTSHGISQLAPLHVCN